VSALGVILRARLRAMRNRIAGIRQESRLRIVVEVGVGTALWAGLYAASAESFGFLSRFPEIREDVVYTALSLLFMSLTILLSFSSAVVSLGTLFRTKETAFLLATPVPAASVYAYRTLEGLMLSSWAFLIMGLPPMLAYGVDVGAPASYYLGIPLFFLPLTLLTSSVGTLLGLLLTGFVPRHRGRLLIAVLLCVVALGAYVAVKVSLAHRGTLAFGELWKEEVLGHLAFLRNRYFPHTWITRGLLMLAAGRPLDAALPLAAVSVSAVFAFLLGDAVARRAYSLTWSLAAGGNARKRVRRGAIVALVELMSRPAGGVARYFIGKDARQFVRDPAQWAQAGIFFGLLGIYVANLRNLHYDFSQGFWLFLVSTLNLAATSLTLATLTTRFVFPQMSLEGKRFWILGLAPVRRRDILYGKFYFALLGSFVVSELLVVTSNFMLRMPREVFLTHAVAMAFVCVGLTGLAVGLGAVFPNYREANPSRIVSGFGGTLTLIVSIVYVVVIVALIAVPTQLRLVHATMGPREFSRWSVVVVLVMAVVTALAAGVPMSAGVKAVERAEF
jgi:ABC-2 type transport system permease protein